MTHHPVLLVGSIGILGLAILEYWRDIGGARLSDGLLKESVVENRRDRDADEVDSK